MNGQDQSDAATVLERLERLERLVGISKSDDEGEPKSSTRKNYRPWHLDVTGVTQFGSLGWYGSAE